MSKHFVATATMTIDARHQELWKAPVSSRVESSVEPCFSAQLPVFYKTISACSTNLVP